MFLLVRLSENDGGRKESGRDAERERQRERHTEIHTHTHTEKERMRTRGKEGGKSEISLRRTRFSQIEGNKSGPQG